MSEKTTVALVMPALELLTEPGAVFGVCALGTKRGAAFGFFDNIEKAALAASAYNGAAKGVYITNPVHPLLLNRCKNRMESYAKTTVNADDILRRDWMLIDFDPIRFDGITGIPSSDSEHKAAITRARSAKTWLQREGWPEPVLADSGNGAHLLVRANLPNDDAARDLVKACIAAIAVRFTDLAVKVDLETYKASQLIRLYGTLNCVGDHSEERPHRVSEILEVRACKAATATA